MDTIRVAAVQAGVDPRWTSVEWTNHLRWQLAACREAGAQLAVFPAWTGVYQESYPSGFPEAALGTLVNLLGGLAREAGLHLVAGTMPIRTARGKKLRSLVLSSSGELLGAQDQLIAPPGYIPGESLRVFPSALGKLGLIADMDVFVPEIGRFLALAGADLFCAPQALGRETGEWQLTTGLWQQVQANQVPGIEAHLAGDFLGKSYGGFSRILVPVEMTADGSGLIARAAGLASTELVVAEIDQAGVEAARRQFPIFSGFNLELYRRRLLPAYQALAGLNPFPDREKGHGEEG